MPKLPPSATQRQSTLNRTMLRNAAAGRTSLVAPQPRPLDPLGTAPPGGDAIATFGATGLYTDLPEYSGPDPARNSGVIYEITFGNAVAASDDTEIEVFRGTTSLGTWTLPAGEGAISDDSDGYTAPFDGGPVTAGNQIRIRRVSGGTDLEDPTIKIAAFSDTGVRGSPGLNGADGADGIMASIVEGPGIGVDDTDPANPIVSVTAGYVEAERTTNQSIPNNTFTAITLTEVSDPLGMFATGASEFTVPTGYDGLWLVTGRVDFASNSSGFREVYVEETTNFVYYDTIIPGLGDNLVAVSGIFRLAAGDQFHLAVKQTSGGSLNVVSAYLTAAFLGAA